MVEQFKRHIAYKCKIGDLLAGKPDMEGDKMKHLVCDEKQIIRTNVVANIVEKYVQEGEKRFGSLTLDDASGQIKLKFFGDDVDKLAKFEQGDTVLVIGLLRLWNNEIYITPEIIKKKELAFLLLRKLETDKMKLKQYDKEHAAALKDKIVEMIKEADKSGGIEVEKIILEMKESPGTINKEIKKLIEDGVAYEPRPGKLRWLG